MPKAHSRAHLIEKSIPAPKHPVVRLLPRPACPSPQSQAVADALNQFKNEALHGVYEGLLILAVKPDGNAIWECHGSISQRDETTKTWAAQLTSAVFRDLA